MKRKHANPEGLAFMAGDEFANRMKEALHKLPKKKHRAFVLRISAAWFRYLAQKSRVLPKKTPAFMTKFLVWIDKHYPEDQRAEALSHVTPKLLPFLRDET